MGISATWIFNCLHLLIFLLLLSFLPTLISTSTVSQPFLLVYVQKKLGRGKARAAIHNLSDTSALRKPSKSLSSTWKRLTALLTNVLGCSFWSQTPRACFNWLGFVSCNWYPVMIAVEKMRWVFFSQAHSWWELGESQTENLREKIGTKMLLLPEARWAPAITSVDGWWFILSPRHVDKPVQHNPTTLCWAFPWFLHIPAFFQPLCLFSCMVYTTFTSISSAPEGTREALRSISRGHINTVQWTSWMNKKQTPWRLIETSKTVGYDMMHKSLFYDIPTSTTKKKVYASSNTIWNLLKHPRNSELSPCCKASSPQGPSERTPSSAKRISKNRRGLATLDV